DVVLVARGNNLAALRTHGLRLAIPERVIQVRPPVVEHVSELTLAKDDVLLLCVKSQDTADLLRQLAPLPVESATAGEVLPLLCVQNGIGNEREASRFFRNVHGVGLMLQATHLEPGKVSATGTPVTGGLELGRYPFGTDPVDEAIAAELSASGFAMFVRSDVMAWKRAKLLGNLGNALEAMCGPDATDADKPVLAEIRARATAEAKACFDAAGMTQISDAEWADHQKTSGMNRAPVEGQSRSGGSTWQSVQRGQGQVETDYLNGEIVLLGRLHGVDTPMNERIQLAMATFVRSGAAAGTLPATALLPTG
ncbi:MAG: 2-dehydropantoate 2-reductase, partial [Pseudonocardiales bacterium]|nr:2-dehydropantoate 2-reductase [Pseudonocardiales bacterium]